MANYDSMTEQELDALSAKIEYEFIALKESRRQVSLARQKKQQERHATVATKDYTVEQLEAILEARRKAQTVSVESAPSDEFVIAS